jgi:PAS domain S-box-containing protein
LAERLRVLILILIMAIGSLLVSATTIWFLYGAAFDEERLRLVEAAQSQARLIEAVARYDRFHNTGHPGGWREATLSQVNEAHREYKGFGETGEFTLAKLEGGLIVFVLGHRHQTVEHPGPVPFDSELAEPMRRALLGQSGTVVGLDYRGEMVVAAYEPVAELDLGIVAKIDLAEVQAPFKKAGLAAAGIAVLVVFAGAILFVRVSSPLVTALESRSRDLEATLAALRESEELFRTTFELAGSGIVQVSLSGRFTRVNKRFCEIVGYTEGEILELRFQDITHPDDLDEDLANASRIIGGEINSYSLEKRYVCKDNSLVWVSLTVSLVRDESEVPSYFIAVAEDTTKRKNTELAVQSSLAEKEVLLREIHHRVKNNMQVISSLLNLQAKNIEDPRLNKVFQESQSRVRAMALIHEILYQSGNLGRIDLGEYVSKLATGLIRMYGTGPDRINLNIGAQDVTLGIDDTVPCGLVINELLSNSLKYAFRDGRTGEIGIDAAPVGNGEITLVVHDDGVGIPAEIDIRNTDTMGMRLVIGLVESQLGGQVDLDRDHGTRFTITFSPTERDLALRG